MKFEYIYYYLKQEKLDHFNIPIFLTNIFLFDHMPILFILSYLKLEIWWGFDSYTTEWNYCSVRLDGACNVMLWGK